MQISAAQQQDLPELAQLYQQLLPNTVHLDNMKQVLARQSDNPSHYIAVAKVDGKVVGSVLSITCEMLFGACQSFMVVEDVVVDHAYQRQGIGAALMADVERRAKQNNCSYIMLVTDNDRSDSQRFYLAQGYKSDPYCAFKKHL